MALEEIARRLGDGVQTLAFGCDAEAFAELRGAPAVGVTRTSDCNRIQSASEHSNGVGLHPYAAGAPAVKHLGLLTRADVAEVMRRTDVFIDASAYQAFGRTGLEAMACGAVPVLPALGGVGEYATHERDAVILERDTPEAIADEVCALIADREHLDRLREAGLRSAAEFSIERAARSQLGLFAAVTTPRPRPATVPA